MKPEQWQAQRRHRSDAPGHFNLPVNTVPEDPEDPVLSVRKPNPKRRWRCPHCPIRFAFEWTMQDHVKEDHLPFLPRAAPSFPKGPLTCRWCPAGYATDPDRQMHERAKHSRNLAVEMGS